MPWPNRSTSGSGVRAMCPSASTPSGHEAGGAGEPAGLGRSVVMRYLLSDSGRPQLDRLTVTPTLYAFDFDGTLASIVRNHQDARLARPIREGLAELGKRA